MAALFDLKAVSIPPFTPATQGTFVDLVNQTLPDADKQLADLDAKIVEMQTIEAALEADLPGMISDVDGIDAVLGEFTDIQWGSPEPDFGPLTDYITAQRDGITGKVDVAQPVPQIPINSPTGQAIITPGAPPSGGGVATSGAAPYVLRHPIAYNFDPARLVGPAQLSGPNPPFVKLNGFAQDNPAAGGRGWVALIEINPAHAGTFGATLTYKLALTLTGINTIISYSDGVTVVVQ